jgi:uncharacterized membrane protein
MSSKFLKDLPEMTEQGVISEEVAQNIRLWYQHRSAEKPNRLLLISGVLGALLIGLGIILILAHNWDFFPKLVKTVLAFTPLLISQALVIYSLQKQSRVWVESTATLLFFSVGTAISLISQIYHLPGNIDNFLFLWILLCAPLIYLLRSKAITLLHLIFITWWAVSSGYGYRSQIPWFFLLFFAWLLPFYRHLFYKEAHSNMISVLSWMLPLSFTIALGAFVDKSELWGFIMYVIFFAIIYQWGSFKTLKEASLMKNGFRVLGLIGLLVVMIIASFRGLWKEIASDGIQGGPELYLIIPLFLILIVLVTMHLKKEKKTEFFIFVPLTLIGIFLLGAFHSVIATIAINAITLATGIIFVRDGALNTSFRKLNLGLLLISVLIACRFFDTDLSFVFKGILFVSIGFGFFLTNYLMLKRKAKS